MNDISKKIQVLEVCAKLNVGGAQAVAANIAIYADKNFHFDYVVFGSEEGEYEKRIIEKGNSVFHIYAPQENVFLHIRDLYRLIRRKKYDAVHCHTMFHCGIVMFLAKLLHVPCRMCHSHTVDDERGKSKSRIIYRAVMRKLIQSCGNVFFACGVAAGEALYGSKWFAEHGRVVKNGIDISKYSFSEQNRDYQRKFLQITDCFVIGNVGHYVSVKNQSFLINLMPEIRKKRENAILLLFGEGEDRERLQKAIDEQKATNYIKLMGNTDEVAEILSALDVFAFPSLFEGTPLALIEAQANGLPCIVSNLIPTDGCITKSVQRLPLVNEEWVTGILNAQREISAESVNELYDVYEDVTDSMSTIYRTIASYVQEDI